ncbi:hypothetical protein [Mycobacterium spongiae]|uniref:Lipoprotein LppW n=1 Tax=Mycobacterium spongiae TaxID=886343 RepID=A0A975JYG2_9MYCO|nr:hypothetical protein [Mycobacterium spongiae]QUR66923.1 hypothetical protein F6B93_07300 [Mycobacterium spongiae]
MRSRPLTMLTAALAVVSLVVGGCEATTQAQASEVSDSAHRVSSPSRPQQQPVELLLRSITSSGAPNVLPTTGFIGLQARIQRATEQAASRGASLSVAILDRSTRRLVSNGNNAIVATASVSKLFIADDLLLRESEGKTALTPEDHHALDSMLRSSDDGAAERFWARDGGNAIVTQVASRYGLASTVPPSDGRWWNTISSAADLIRYYEMLLNGAGGLPLERASVILNDLAKSTPTGIDGYPQRFGIPDGLFNEKVAVKQGWMCCIGRDWIHLSTGVIGADRRYIMVIESLQASNDAIARETITQAVRTMFPNGRI